MCKQDIVKEMLAATLGDNYDRADVSTTLTTQEKERRNLLIERRMLLLYQAKSMKGRKQNARLEVRFLHFLKDIGWPATREIPISFMDECIAACVNESYRKDPAKKGKLQDLWSLVHANDASLWVSALSTSRCNSRTVKTYVGAMKGFSKSLGFTGRFAEDRKGSSSTIVIHHY